MIFLLFLVFMFAWMKPVLALDVRNQVIGSDNNVWRAVRNANNTVTVFKNDSTAGVPQPGGALLSKPALALVGSTVYMIGRGTDNQVYCNRISSPYTSWVGWQVLSGLFVADAPAAVSRLGNVFAAVRGTDNALYTRIVTNCGGSWSFTGWFTNAAPQMISDDSGVRIYFQTPEGEFRRFLLGTSGAPFARSFGDDKELRGDRMIQSDGVAIGYGEITHPIVYGGDAMQHLRLSVSAPAILHRCLA